MGGAAAFADGPDDQALAAADVAGSEDAGDAAHVIVVDLHVAALVFGQTELLDGAGVFGVDETQGQQA